MSSDDDEIIIRNGELKKWWNDWIRYYDVILPLGLKVRAWRLLCLPVLLAGVIGAVLGALVG